MMNYDIEIPFSWDKDFKEKLRSEVFWYLDTYFYDGPFDHDSIMHALMWNTKGKCNPKQLSGFVEDWLVEN